MSPASPAELADFLPGQRWYGEKAEPIQTVSIVDSGRSGAVDHLLIDVHSSGGVARYYVPVMRTPDGGLIDAATAPEFHVWLGALEETGSLELKAGRLVWTRAHGAAPIAGAARLMTAEQSNSSIRFGDQALIKVFRRLRPGINPEIELTRHLSEDTSFRNAPALLGWLDYRPFSGEPVSLAVAQSYIESISDGWSAVLADLDAIKHASHESRERTTGAAIERIGRLGNRTAELHLALSQPSGDPALSPEEISPRDAENWKRAFVTLLGRVRESLASRPASGDPNADLIAAFLSARASFAERISQFDRLAGLAKTRVHGDYHLGQTLLTPGGDWFLLDFEGEPRRSIEERRAKTSPLKDVAGMLRSFSYARGTAERPQMTPGGATALISWERGARLAYLTTYFETARAGKAGFLPATFEDFRLALGAWELDKAIYEIDYELNNRPDWLWLPLSGALKLI